MQYEWQIEIDGKPLSDEVRRLVQSISIRDEIEQRADSCSVTFADPENVMKKPRRGGELKIYLGVAGEKPKLMGRYIIKSLARDEKLVRVSAKGFDPLKGIRNSASAYYSSKSVAEIVREVCGRNKVAVKVSSDFDSVKVDEAQKDESDLNFLQRLARDNHAVIKVQGSEVLFITRSKGRSPSGRDLPVIELDLKGAGAFYSYSEDDNEEIREVRAKYFDKKTGDKGDTKVGGGSPSRELPDLYPSRAAAEIAAKARLASGREENEKLTLSFPLDPRVLAERQVNIKNLSAWVDGRWIVTSASHEIGKSFKTSLELRKVLSEDER